MNFKSLCLFLGFALGLTILELKSVDGPSEIMARPFMILNYFDDMGSMMDQWEKTVPYTKL